MGVRRWWNRKKELINAGLTFNRAAGQWEKDMQAEANPVISITKGLKAIAGLAFFAGVGGAALFLLEPGVMEAALAAAGVHSAYAAAIVLVLRGAATAWLNYRKHRGTGQSTGQVGVASVLILGLLPAFASAQEPAKEPATKPAVTVNLYGGAMQFAERCTGGPDECTPDHKDFVSRLTLTVPAPSGLTLFARADWTRTQDGGDLYEIQTFRSIEGFAGGRKDVGSGFAVLAYGGATWNRDSNIEPTDPRLYTMAAGVRFEVPGRGYVIASAGHHGPVGGSAFLGSVVYEINDGASWFGDVAIPLDASRFAIRPYTVKFGISAKLKGWRF